MGCKVQDCKLVVICKGFCRKHSSAYYRGQIAGDGTPVNYRPRPKHDHCTFGLCTKKVHGNGLCGKHRKWLDKGHIDRNHKILRPEKCKERLEKCKICDSTNLKGYGFCQRHYREYKVGDIGINGNRINLSGTGPLTVEGKPRRRVTGKQICSVHMCFSRNKISKGLCRKHQGMVRAGTIDSSGKKLRDPMRVRTYRGKRCLICPEPARSRGFCRNHFNHFTRGNLDITGKWLVPEPVRNQGKTCKHPGCTKEAKIKHLCVQHRSWERTGFVGWKNKGHTCSEIGCSKPAAARTLCHAHYRKLRISEKTIQQ